jgi:peptidoglycan hydrolase-like protein with peptidoglycan-binding domain
MLRSDIADMQKALEAKGHDVGGADGFPGFKTRRAIGRWQESKGMKATCFPDPSLEGQF